MLGAGNVGFNSSHSLGREVGAELAPAGPRPPWQNIAPGTALSVGTLQASAMEEEEERKHLHGSRAWLGARGGCASTGVPRWAPHPSRTTTFTSLHTPAWQLLSGQIGAALP